MEQQELIFVLDRSSSMAGKEREVISGYNHFLAQQAAAFPSLSVSTVLFSDEATMLYSAQPPQAARLRKGQYIAHGMTAFYDALGHAILAAQSRHARTAPPATCLVVAFTDGWDNCSRRFTRAGIRSLVERQRRQYGWQFIFMAADIDGRQAAGQIAIPAADTVEYASIETGFDEAIALVNRRALQLYKMGKTGTCTASPPARAQPTSSPEAFLAPPRASELLERLHQLFKET